MKKKRIVIVLAVVTLLLAGAAFKFRESSAQPKQTDQRAPAIPDFEVYRQMFHHHVTMKQKADELEKQGKDAKVLREFYKRQANLTEQEAQAFDDIASDCEKQVAQQDAKARAIVDKALAANGNGKLAAGQKPPAPPEELRTLWNERNATIMRAKYALQAAFGDSEFSRFESYRIRSSNSQRILSTGTSTGSFPIRVLLLRQIRLPRWSSPSFAEKVMAQGRAIHFEFSSGVLMAVMMTTQARQTCT
ncbi:MAG TPA: hypothetical protein VHQ64_06350 [Pyrinomonadaceae bacterium]|nr:hypothetical protein [Pyrinomonadaceae bacterium]